MHWRKIHLKQGLIPNLTSRKSRLENRPKQVMYTKYAGLLKCKKPAFAGFYLKIKKFMIPPRFCFRATLAALLAFVCLFLLAGPFSAGAEDDAGVDKIYEPADTRVRVV